MIRNSLHHANANLNSTMRRHTDELENDGSAFMTTTLDPKRVALILIGFQNDYFSSVGALHSAVQDSSVKVLANTIETLNRLKETDVTIISTPILFTPDYSELIEPTGILKIIKDKNAFRADTIGGETVPEIRSYGKRIIEVPGKRGLNAFSNTDLNDLLKERNISIVALLGVVTSLCIESTGREAFERGYRVIIVSDATAGRTEFEQKFYCSEIFPMYAEVIDHEMFVKQLGV